MKSKIKGELKIEFYAHLEEIKELYFNQGIVIFKILHQKMVASHNLTISYKMFCYYAQQELKAKKQDVSLANKIKKERKEEGANSATSKEKAHEPIVATFKMSDIKPYNPHTSEIDEHKILK